MARAERDGRYPMTRPADAARAVARVARALAPLGPDYPACHLILHSTGDRARDLKALTVDLEYLAAYAARFEPDTARQVEQAATAALDALPEALPAGFFTTVRALIKEGGS